MNIYQAKIKWKMFAKLLLHLNKSSVQVDPHFKYLHYIVENIIFYAWEKSFTYVQKWSWLAAPAMLVIIRRCFTKLLIVTLVLVFVLQVSLSLGLELGGHLMTFIVLISGQKVMLKFTRRATVHHVMLIKNRRDLITCISGHIWLLLLELHQW